MKTAVKSRKVRRIVPLRNCRNTPRILVGPVPSPEARGVKGANRSGFWQEKMEPYVRAFETILAQPPGPNGRRAGVFVPRNISNVLKVDHFAASVRNFVVKHDLEAVVRVDRVNDGAWLDPIEERLRWKNKPDPDHPETSLPVLEVKAAPPSTAPVAVSNTGSEAGHVS